MVFIFCYFQNFPRIGEIRVTGPHDHCKMAVYKRFFVPLRKRNSPAEDTTVWKGGAPGAEFSVEVVTWFSSDGGNIPIASRCQRYPRSILGMTLYLHVPALTSMGEHQVYPWDDP